MLFSRSSNILLGGVVFSIVLMSAAFLGYLSDTSNLNNTYSFESKLIADTRAFALQTFSLVELFEKTEPGVVSITVSKSTEYGTSGGFGSGFVFDTEGHIITNNHVVENSEKIIVTFIDGTSYNAKIIGTDPYADIAVIKLDVNPDNLFPLSIGDSSKLQVGEQIAAIGNPFGLSGSMTSGIISQLGRLLPSQGSLFSIPDVIQTDAAINPGNSGGPLLNMQGEVIGINTAIYSTDGNFSGVGFSIPSNLILKIVPDLIDKGNFSHPWVGISSTNISLEIAELLNLDDTIGVLIMTVVKDSPADKAGLLGSSQTTTVEEGEFKTGGDIILSVDGNAVRTIDDLLIHLQREKNIGDELNLGILRDGEMLDVTLILEDRPRQ